MTTDFAALATSILAAARARVGTSVLYATPSLGTTSADVLDRLERDIDAPLPAEIRGFYAGAEQLGLVWQEGGGAETSEQPKDWAELSNTDGPYWKRALRGSRDLTKRGGMICIPRATEVFRKGAWLDNVIPEAYGDELTLDGESYTDRAVYADLYPFDFITTYYCAGLWFNRAAGAWRIVFAGDHGASWADYRTLGVAEYLEQLASGLGGARHLRSAWDADNVKEIWALRAED